MCRTYAIGIIVALVLAILGISLLGGELSRVLVPPQPSETDELVSARAIDADGCAVEATNQFSPSESIFIVWRASRISEGTEIFARLSHEGNPVEDSILLTADQYYAYVCVYFEFEATSGAEVLETGEYSAQVIIDGIRGPSVNFEVE